MTDGKLHKYFAKGVEITKSGEELPLFAPGLYSVTSDNKIFTSIKKGKHLLPLCGLDGTY